MIEVLHLHLEIKCLQELKNFDYHQVLFQPSKKQ